MRKRRANGSRKQDIISAVLSAALVVAGVDALAQTAVA